MCMNSQGVQVSDALCDTGTKPATTQTCATNACPTPTTGTCNFIVLVDKQHSTGEQGLMALAQSPAEPELLLELFGVKISKELLSVIRFVTTARNLQLLKVVILEPAR